MVTKVDRESLGVIDQNGIARTLLPSSISGKLERRRNAVATDKDGIEIRNDDTVKEAGGDQRQGRILHIHRAFLFLHSRNHAENSGIFVLRSSQVIAIAAHGARAAQAGPDLTKMNPQIGGVNNQNGMLAPPKPMGGRDRMIGKACSIKKGPYKGLLGIIKETTDTTATVELHSRKMGVTVPKDIVGIRDPVTGNPIDMSRFGGPPRSQFDNPAVPSAGYGGGAATPGPWNVAQGGRTPGPWGGATNLPGGRTPGPWNMPGYGGSGGRTPAPYNDGSRTQYAPAYTDGSKSAYGPMAGGRTPGYVPGWADGGKTLSAPRDDGYE